MLVVRRKDKGISVQEASFRDICEAVYLLLMLIPSGYVTSYKNLGEALGLHPRVVAYCLKVNRDLIVVPCHRVVYSSRELGGYSVLGKNFKRRLLEVEGVKFEGNKVALGHFIDINSLLKGDNP